MSLHYPPSPSDTAVFQHVQIIDGTWRSICLRCYLTAGRAEKEDGLEREEQEHVCQAMPRDRRAVGARPAA